MIHKIFSEYQGKIDARLDILLNENDRQYDEVVRAARYSLLSSGKRIRPILLLEFYNSLFLFQRSKSGLTTAL